MTENNNQQNLNNSSGNLSGFSDRVVSMPESFYGTKENLTRPQDLKVQYQPAVSPEVPKKPMSQKPTKIVSKTTYLIIGIGVLLLLGLVGYLIYLMYFSNPQTLEQLPGTIEVENSSVPPIINEPEIELPLENEPPVVEEPPIIEEPIPRILSLMHDIDTDGDLLTDNEEYVLKTNAAEKDTDGDGYIDGQEFINFFNPIASEPAELEFSGLVVTYVNPIFAYNVFYPIGWFARSVDQAASEVIITSIAGEFVSIKVLENSLRQAVDVWYLSTFPQITSNEIKIYSNRQGDKVVQSPDEFTSYLAKNDLIYEIKYDIGAREKASYPNIYQMMVNGFIFTNNGL